MRNFLKFIFILFAGMLSYGSISGDFYEKLPSADKRETGEGYFSSSIRESKQVEAFCLHQPLVNLVNPLNHFPRPDSKYHPLKWGLAVAAVETGIRNIAAQYLSFSGAKPLGLAVSDIIFPFHYFW